MGVPADTLRPSLPPQSTVLGRFQVTHLADRNAPWDLYAGRATDDATDEPVRVAVLRLLPGAAPGLDPDKVTAALADLTALRIAGIAPVLAAGYDRDACAVVLVTAELEGATLREWLAAAPEGRAPEEIARITLEVACALDAMHARAPSMAHGRLDPDAVVLAPPDARAVLRDALCATAAARTAETLGSKPSELWPELLAELLEQDALPQEPRALDLRALAQLVELCLEPHRRGARDAKWEARLVATDDALARARPAEGEGEGDGAKAGAKRFASAGAFALALGRALTGGGSSAWERAAMEHARAAERAAGPTVRTLPVAPAMGAAMATGSAASGEANGAMGKVTALPLGARSTTHRAPTPAPVPRRPNGGSDGAAAASTSASGATSAVASGASSASASGPVFAASTPSSGATVVVPVPNIVRTASTPPPPSESATGDAAQSPGRPTSQPPPAHRARQDSPLGVVPLHDESVHDAVTVTAPNPLLPPAALPPPPRNAAAELALTDLIEIDPNDRTRPGVTPAAELDAAAAASASLSGSPPVPQPISAAQASLAGVATDLAPRPRSDAPPPPRAAGSVPPPPGASPPWVNIPAPPPVPSYPPPSFATGTFPAPPPPPVRSNVVAATILGGSLVLASAIHTVGVLLRPAPPPSAAAATSARHAATSAANLANSAPVAPLAPAPPAPVPVQAPGASSAQPQDVVAPSTADAATSQPDPREAAARRAIETRAAACVAQFPTDRHRAHVDVTYDGATGRVVRVELTSTAMRGTPLGTCITRAAGAVTMAPFAEPRRAVSYTLRLP